VSSRLTRPCEGCGKEIDNWRSCPVKECPVETVFCTKCGGDDRAMVHMKDHIDGHHFVFAIASL
jgi:hypothetical protein